MEKIIYYLLNRFVMTNVEKEILSHMKNKNQVIFDIGCYKGYFTKGIIGNDKKNLKNKKFYLFDGNPNSKKFLKDLLNNKNIRFYNLAIHNTNSNKNYYINNFFEPSGSSLIPIYNKDLMWNLTRKIFMKIFNPLKKISGYSKVKVKTQTLDTFCRKKKIKKIDLLKIDTEGNEYNVLQGTKTLLKKNKIFVIYMEISDTKRNYIKKEKKIINFLKRFNFELVSSYKMKSFSILSGLRANDNIFVNRNLIN